MPHTGFSSVLNLLPILVKTIFNCILYLLFLLLLLFLSLELLLFLRATVAVFVGGDYGNGVVVTLNRNCKQFSYFLIMVGAKTTRS